MILSLKESLAINQQLTAEIETLKSQINNYLSNGDTHFRGINERLNILDHKNQEINESLNILDHKNQEINERLNILD
ncbi:MAG: SAM-dependent methyltransferase, partial [Dolichospermum sp.]